MSHHSSSTEAPHHGYPRSRPAQHRRPEMANMDTTLAGEGAWTQGTDSKERKPRRNDASVSSAQSADSAGMNFNEDLSDVAFLSADCWTYPSDIHLERAQGTSIDLSRTAQHADYAHAVIPELSFDDHHPVTEEDLAARELTPAALASLPRLDSMAGDEVYRWIPTPTGHRVAIPTVAQNNGRGSRHRGPTRERGTASSSWVFVSAASHAIDRDTRGLETGVSLPSHASHSTWLDVDQVVEASLHYST